jgi:RNA polymerase sigma factor (sigma-70 family)
MTSEGKEAFEVASPPDALLESCLAGDREARQELAVRISKLVYLDTNRAAFSLGLRLSREDADDINQDILLKLFAHEGRKLRSFGGRSSFERWIYVIVYNCLVDRARSADEQARRRTTSIHAPSGSDPDSPTLEDSLADTISDPREVLEYRGMLESLRVARQEVLTEEERTILDLWCCRQYTTDQIGTLMKRKPNTISTLIHRAQAKILEYLREKEPDSV